MPPIIPIVLIDPANYRWVQEVDVHVPVWHRRPVRIPMKRLRRSAALGTLALAAAAACGLRPTPGAPTPPAATPGAATPGSTTPQPLVDCFWSADAYAWVDTNRDGVIDDAEPPLEGVELDFSLSFVDGATTGPDGNAHIWAMIPSECQPEGSLTLIAKAPAGYTPTTETALVYTDDRERYDYGFAPAP
jgi:hypothetical protein